MNVRESKRENGKHERFGARVSELKRYKMLHHSASSAFLSQEFCILNIFFVGLPVRPFKFFAFMSRVHNGNIKKKFIALKCFDIVLKIALFASDKLEAPFLPICPRFFSSCS